MKVMFERIVYVSKAHPDVGARDAYDIIRVAHNRNSRCGLTGALLMLDGHFLQVLEGEGFHINERLAAICKDPRHYDVQLRSRVAVDTPAFPDEWMALRLADGVPDLVKTEFNYQPGFPPELFNAEQLLAFAQACCEPAAA
jgi:Sensors of blue-light using FAD